MLPSERETAASPLYRPEFKDLDYSRLMPAGTRYKPREDRLIGVVETARLPARNVKVKRDYAISDAELAQAQANRKPPANRLIRPHSIATRCIEAMRERGGWFSTAELLDLSNRHRPESCTLATPDNIYWALSDWRKKGVVESRRASPESRFVEWRVKP